MGPRNLSPIGPFTCVAERAFEQVFQDKPKDQIKIVDATAGTGWLGVELKKLEYTNLYALDISPEMLKLAKKKKIYNDLICAALNGQPIPQIETGQFDALICGGSILEGCIGPSAFMEMIRMVRAGGFLCFNIRASDVGMYLDQMKELEKADGLLCFNIREEESGGYQEMMSKLEKAGKWICWSKQTLPQYAAEDMPKETLGFVYTPKILLNVKSR
ncbi:hypothetical protein AWC38_SpisGene14804 [Stylophora pistillata]|uniref:Methyltransferase domain-containing protein n=1 Tax=Stylophora pistillata TaxID=50429 RepID=A0A2B4RWN2_STYPI|nr:hypothetical protein AWC38_SpisGene14804 [Stylophora pistillata]